MTNVTHAQALDKLAARTLVQNLEEDIARQLGSTLAYAKYDRAIAADPAAHALVPLLRRWNCVLQAGADAASPIYRDKTAVALAILLHKYGIADAAIAARADAANDALNTKVALSDDFHRRSDAIKTMFLRTAPAPLKRAPGHPDSLSFHRAADVVSMQLDGRYYAAYVHGCVNPNESPIIEFYDAVFDHVPSLAELTGRRAKGQRYDDGSESVSKYSVAGMKFMPDPAGQIVLVKACVETAPDNAHLPQGVGLFTVSDIFDIQGSVGRMFGQD
jgi:hypothetical protein